MPKFKNQSTTALFVTAGILATCLIAGGIVFVTSEAARAHGTVNPSGCALGFTIGDPGTGDPYPDRGDADGSAAHPYPLGSTVVCAEGGVAWTIALGQPEIDPLTDDSSDADRSYMVVPVEARYVGTETSVITDDLQFSYVDSAGVDRPATADPARSDSLFEFPRLFPNGVATGSVAIAVPAGDDLAGRFVVTIAATDQVVNFAL